MNVTKFMFDQVTKFMFDQVTKFMFDQVTKFMFRHVTKFCAKPILIQTSPNIFFFYPHFISLPNERDDRPAHFRIEVRRGKNISSLRKSWSKTEF